MSSASSALSVAGTRQTGQPVRTQNGKKFMLKIIYLLQLFC